MDRKTPAQKYGPLPEGVEVREGKRGDRIRIVFNWQEERCRETLDIPCTEKNIQYAARKLAEIYNQIERGTFSYKETFPNSKRAKLDKTVRKQYQVHELVHDYIDNGRTTKSLSPSSIDGHQRWYNARVKPYFEDMPPVDQMTTGDMKTWVLSLIKVLSPKSVRNLVGLVSAALTVAVMDEKIARNPLAKISLKSLLPKRRKKEENKIDPFNLQEIEAILAACPTPQDKSMWQFAFGSGSRPGELIAFKWPHVNWVEEIIHFQDNIVSAEGGTVEKDLKTEESERDVPMLPAAKEALLRMRPISELKSEYVFLNPATGKRWLDNQQMRLRWKYILRKAGVRYRNPYQTRHTFASHLLEAGEHEIVVARLLGHTTPEMVRRVYGKYIRKPDGVKLRGDYSKFGADLGQETPSYPVLISANEN
jgi:integrase